MLASASLAMLALIPSVVGYGHIINHVWTIDAPSDGLSDLTFPITLNQVHHERGYYFAQQFNFYNNISVGYIGVQPRKDSNCGKPVLHAAFSSFQKGATSKHPNCTDGADGGSGVSCAIEFAGGSYDHTWNYTVDNTEGTTWRGRMIDTVTGDSHEIGVWTLPETAGKIRPDQLGFFEYYPWNGEPADCPNLPLAEVTFGWPTSSQGSGGLIKEPYEVGDCKGKTNATWNKVEEGWVQKAGFI